jgi:hypothetical protein
MPVSASLLSSVLTLSALVIGAPAPAWAQAPVQHGMPRAPDPIQARVAEAERAAVARVEAIEGGRIRLATLLPVLGATPERFEVKRKPSAPLPLAVGDRVLLLLRGARSPYLVVDVPDDTIRIADDAAAARWAEAIRAVAVARGEPALLLSLFLRWSESEDDALRAEAMRALTQIGSGHRPLPRALALARAQVALDPARAPKIRRSAALLATSDDDALDLLLTRIAAKPAGADPEVVVSVLSAGFDRGRRGAGGALASALHTEDPELRLAVLGVVTLAPPGSQDAALAALAERDSDPRVRELAAHWLARVQRARANGR